MIVKYYKTKRQIQKRLYGELNKYNDTKLVVRCYSSWGMDDELITDLEIDVLDRAGDYLDSITIMSLETEDNNLEVHRGMLRKQKLNLYKFLSDTYDVVELGEDYTQ